MEGREIVNHPFFFDTIDGGPALAVFGRRKVAAENDQVQSSWWCIVDPLGCEQADGLKGGQVDLLGVDQLGVALCSQVFDIVDQERI